VEPTKRNTMLRRFFTCGGLALCISACSPARPHLLDGPPPDLKASSAELFQQYGAAISAPRREALARFYHHQGAVRVLNGARSALTPTELDSIYRGPWIPPEYFAWDALAYDSLGPGLVVVTGGFRWKARDRPDTVRYLYTALLEAVDSGMVIRFEQETVRPPR
jgi:hypothetical protein